MTSLLFADWVSLAVPFFDPFPFLFYVCMSWPISWPVVPLLGLCSPANTLRFSLCGAL